MLFVGNASYAAGSSSGIISEIGYIKALLSQVGPALSATLFVVAGIFYAIGQMLPPDKKANFHTTSINIIIGAIVVAVLSVASTALASASSHLLTNMTIANMS
ncbi:membrane protein [mine drainage metagenome]|uniref:Membrane protein n=1 Tax=mine drainage metagenome TaxID=410659 RepID=T0YYE9_9ZZZZ